MKKIVTYTLLIIFLILIFFALEKILPCGLCGEKRDVIETLFKTTNKVFMDNNKSIEELEEGAYGIPIYKSICEDNGIYALYRMQSKIKTYNNFLNYYKNHQYNKKDITMINNLRKMCSKKVLKNINKYIIDKNIHLYK